MSGLMVKMTPSLTLHFESLNIHPLMYATPWFMCLFSSLPCWDTVLCIWDAFIFGGISALLATSLTVMKSCEADLLEMDSIALVLPYLQHLPQDKVWVTWCGFHDGMP